MLYCSYIVFVPHHLNKECTVSYYESAEDTVISKARALEEIDAHDGDRDAFLAEMGSHATYDAQTVLGWLGY